MTLRLATAFACSFVMAVAAQEPREQPVKPPTFRAGVELLTVDVNAVDKDGQPVQGLTPADFTVEIGGKRRTVVRTDFIDFAAGGAAVANLPDVTSNQTDTAAPEARAILLLVDDESLSAAEGKAVLLRMADLVPTLFPRDLMAYAPISGQGPVVEFTTDRKPILDALRAQTGHRPGLPPTFGDITIAEAYAIARGDVTTLSRVVERQCPTASGGRATSSTREMQAEGCRRGVRQDSLTLANENDQRVTRVLNTIQRHITALASIPGTKYLLLVSQGIALDTTVGPGVTLGRSAAAAGVRLHALQVTDQVADASRMKGSATVLANTDLAFQGLDLIARSGGGSVYRVMGDVSIGFERIRREMAAVYRLGIESDPSDSSGGERSINVKCLRPGVTIHSHRQVILPDRRSAESPRDRLTKALASPGIERGIALRLATFVYRGEKNNAQIVASVETDADAASLHIAYALRDKQGKVVEAAEINRNAIILEKDAPPLAVFRTAVGPGNYEVRLAAIDGEGRVGSIVRTVSVDKPSVSSPEGIALSDLLVLPADVEIARMRPSARIAQGSREASVYFEVYAASVPKTDVPVVVEICESPEGPALATTKSTVSLKHAGTPPRAGARLSFSPAALPAGHYFARVSVEGTSARTLRGFSVISGGVAALLADEARALVPPFTIEHFLSPELLRGLSSRLSLYGETNDAAQAAAKSVADGSWRTVTAHSGEPVIDATVAGLQALSAGRPGDAEKLFRDAVNEDPEFTIALTLAGAAWAAVGRDIEAARAWRTSLATGIQAPFIYLDVASALLRQGDVKGFDEFRREISDPERTEPLMREAAIAAAISGDRRRAAKALALWVDAHPDDHDVAFLLLLALYELKSFEKDARAGADLQVRAKAYIDRDGPRRALVARWLK